MSSRQKFLLIFGFIILNMFMLVSFLVIRDATMENELKNEMEYLSKLDITKDRYNKKTYDQVNFRVKKGFKADIEAYANSSGLSLNQWILDAVMEKMQRQDESFVESVTRESFNE